MAQNMERVALAKKVSLVEYIEAQGLALKREGTFFRLADDPRVVIDSGANRWYDNGTSSQAHDPIDWLTIREGKSWGRAIADLLAFDGLGASGGATTPPSPPKAHRGALVASQPLTRQGYAYLCKTRGLPQGTVRDWVGAGLLHSDPIGNAVWDALDDQGHTVGQIVRGVGPTRFVSGHGSKAWPVQRVIGTPRRAIVFEAPIDAMSFEAMYHPTDRLLIAMGGLIPAQLAQTLKAYKLQGRELTLAVDNDPPGAQFVDQVLQTWPEARHITPPQGKDWNEYLLTLGGAAPLLPEVKK